MVPRTKPRTYFPAQIPTSGTPFRFFLPSTGSCGTSSPASSVLRRCCDFLPPIPPRFVILRVAVPRLHSLFSLLGGRVRRRGLELMARYLRPGCCRGNGRISQVPGEPRLSVCACSKPTPAGLLAPDHYGTAAWPLNAQLQRLPQGVFRRSIAWLSDSLSTLRRGRCLPTTQDSLPGAGQALLDGLFTRKVPMKGFKAADYISSPFPKLAWRNGRDLRTLAQQRKCSR